MLTRSRCLFAALLVSAAGACSGNVPQGPGSGGAGGGSSSGSGGGTDSGGGSGGGGAPGTGGVRPVGSGGSGNGAGTGGGGPASDLPVIMSFRATPAILPAGGGAVTLTWQVLNADSLSIDKGVGAVSGTSMSAMTSVTASTIFTLTATNAHGSVTSPTAVGVGRNPSTGSPGRYVAMVSPSAGQDFMLPATLRLVGVGYDPNVYTNVPVGGRGTNASKVQFFVDETMVMEEDGANAEYDVFKGFVDLPAAIGPGNHSVWARAIYVNPSLQLDSAPMIITLVTPPAYARTVDLDADVTVGSQGYAVEGAAGARVRLNGNGHRIVSGGATAGTLSLRFVDVFDLGSPTNTAQGGIEVTTTGAVTIEDCTFSSSNGVRATLNGTATASIRRNTFRSNMRMPIGQLPGGPDSHPSLLFTGSSTGAKVFAGNNVGAGWVQVDSAKAWVVGGDTDADSNVLIGPRVGIYVTGSSNVQVRRNYSHHVYYGGWSQGSNFELQDSPSITVEHNVIYDSSWPVRGVSCEFRYNLVLEAGHQWLWPATGGRIHHNVFLGGDNDEGGLFLVYDDSDIRVFNNTIDGLGDWNTALALQMGAIALTSNAFVRVPDGKTVNVTGGTLTADYNFFDNGQAGNYSDGRHPAHDVVGGNAMLAMPPTRTFDLDEAAIWTRGTTAAAVLSLYRTRYTPLAGSPLIDAGDPQDGAGNDIGAVGAGQPSATDKFGLP